MGNIDIVFWNYKNVDINETLINISGSLAMCMSYLTADYLFRRSPKKAHLIRESINKVIPILNKIEAGEKIDENEQETIIKNLEKVREHREDSDYVYYCREMNLLIRWDEAAKNIIKIIKQENTEKIIQKVSINKNIFSRSFKELKRTRAPTATEIGDLKNG